MDIFKQKRYLTIAVIILLLMNLTTLTLLWIGRPEGHKPPRDRGKPVDDRAWVQELLQQQRGFDENQVGQYLKLRAGHRSQARKLEAEIQKLKKEMFDEVLKENPRPTLSDSLLALVQDRQVRLEKITFQHFLDLKNLCRPEQQDQLKILMHEVFRPGPMPGQGAEVPLPPDRQERPAPPPPSPGDELPPPPPGK